MDLEPLFQKAFLPVTMPGEFILLGIQAIIALAVFGVRSQIGAVKELVTVRLDAHEKRLDNLEK